MDRHNLVLTGFMGTGKTSVGRAAAQQLDREFVDMDQMIAAREGAPVAEIFARHGEAYFRKRERELCAELAARDNLVIATGGGTLVDPVNRTIFAGSTVICLDASVESILHRLNGMRDRPLLDSEPANPNFQIPNSKSAVGRRERIEELLAARRNAYAQIPVHVDTTGRSIEEVAGKVLEGFAVAQNTGQPRVTEGGTSGTPRVPPRGPHLGGNPRGMTEASPAGSVPLQVGTPEAPKRPWGLGSSYPIWLGQGMLDRIGETLLGEPRAEFAARCAVVTNPTVGQLYAARVTGSLRAGGFDPVVVEIPDGEEFKNLDTLRGLYDQFIHARLERSSIVLALGGGVVGDSAGFAAATFMRGVPFVQLPTTLLAMVDASIGGKVAVDHPSGKNLIGAFKFPRAVIADIDVLATLPVPEFRAGLAEVVKHAIVGDARLFDELADGEVNADLIARAMRVKIDLVERDPFEANVRAHLNLGHTFGHALETLSGYRLRHGYAVAMGLTIAARLAARIGWCREATRDRIIDLLELVSLPTRTPREFGAAQVLEAMGADKKIREGRLRLILPRAIGLVEIADAERVPREEIVAALEESSA